MTDYKVEFYKDNKKVSQVKFDNLCVALSFGKFIIGQGYSITVTTIEEKK